MGTVIENVAILGAGGNVGSAVIQELRKQSTKVTITAITRASSSYTPPAGSNIQHKTIDYSSFSSLHDALKGQDAVVNCVTGSATQYEPSKLIIDAAIAAKVKFFFANEFVGYTEREQFKRLPESAAGAKVRTREYLELKGVANEVIWTSLNGGPFFDMWLMKGPGGFNVKERRARIYGTGDNPLCWTPLPIMALAVVNILRNPDSVRNRPVYITPFPHLTQNMILSTLETVLDTKFTVEKVDVEKINRNARIALERGEVMKAMKGLAVSNQFYEGDSGNDFRHVVNNDLVGISAMSVEDAVRDAIARFGEDCPIVEGMFNVEPCDI